MARIKYYNGTDWVYADSNPQTLLIDDTLTKNGFAADAKATGDAIDALKNYITPEMFGAVGDGETDDSEAIQDAIDYLYENDGGTIWLKSNQYKTVSDIVIKEGVQIVGNGSNKIFSANKFEFCRHTKARDFDIIVDNDYDSDVLYFSNANIISNSNKDKIGTFADIFIKNVRLLTELDVDNTGKVAIKMYATRSTEAHAYAAGYAGVTFEDCFIEGFALSIAFETELTGWLNGNIFRNVTIDHFVTAVKINKSADSLGVDYNVFQLTIQTRDTTGVLFEDVGDTNSYENCTIWDMKSYPNATLGRAPLKNLSNGGIPRPKERYTYLLSPRKFYLLGEFSSFASRVQKVSLSMYAQDNYRTDYTIMGNNTIEKRVYGKDKFDNVIKFYKRTLETGNTQLYIYCDNDDGADINIFFDAMRSFYPAPPLTRYNEPVEDVEEITEILTFYPSAKGFYTTGKNANGTWVKYDDGTMICRHTVESAIKPNQATGAIFCGDNETWTFPQTFASDEDLVVNVSCSYRVRWGSLATPPSVSSCKYTLLSAVSSNDTGKVYLSAIGRWK